VKYIIRGTTFRQPSDRSRSHRLCIKGDTWIGPFEPTNTPMSRIEELAGFLTRAGMNTIPLKDARGAQWTKLIFNASTILLGPDAVASRRSHAIRLDRPAFDDLIAKAKPWSQARHRVARRSQATRPESANAPGKHRASMLQTFSPSARRKWIL